MTSLRNLRPNKLPKWNAATPYRSPASFRPNTTYRAVPGSTFTSTVIRSTTQPSPANGPRNGTGDAHVAAGLAAMLFGIGIGLGVGLGFWAGCLAGRKAAFRGQPRLSLIYEENPVACGRTGGQHAKLAVPSEQRQALESELCSKMLDIAKIQKALGQEASGSELGPGITVHLYPKFEGFEERGGDKDMPVVHLYPETYGMTRW